MKSLNYSLLRAICAFVVGLVLVLFPAQAGEYLIITLAVVFMVPALVSFVAYAVQKHKKQDTRFPIEGVGSLLFGLWLMVMPDFFADLLTIVLAVVLVIGGVQQVVSLLLIRRTLPVSIGFYVLPVLIVVAGIVAVFNPTGARSVVLMIVGVSSLVYAVSEVVTWFVFRRRMQKMASVTHAKNYADVEDAEIVE